MSDAKYGEHGKIYSRKGRYHKNYPKKAGQNKSQVAEKSQTVREMPAVKSTDQVFPWEPPEHFQCRSIISPGPAVTHTTWIDHLLKYKQAMIRSVIRAKRTIYLRKLVMEMVMMWLALMIGGLIMMLLWR